MSAFADHFSARAGGYAAFRPDYPTELVDWVASLAPSRALAWDCATGSGQAAVALAERFERVVATDASAAQIASARPHPRVAYRVARAEASGLEAASAGLVTVAQALHWLDVPAFWSEVRRVLAPRGAVAAWGYGNPRLDDARADRVLTRFLAETVGPDWPPERAILLDGYRSLPFPFEEVREAPRFELTRAWTLDELLGYVSTWSATARHAERTGRDPLPELAEALRPLWPAGDGSRSTVRWPITLRAGRT